MAQSGVIPRTVLSGAVDRYLGTPPRFQNQREFPEEIAIKVEDERNQCQQIKK